MIAKALLLNYATAVHINLSEETNDISGCLNGTLFLVVILRKLKLLHVNSIEARENGQHFQMKKSRSLFFASS